MKAEIGTEEWEYLYRIFVILSLQCIYVKIIWSVPSSFAGLMPNKKPCALCTESLSKHLCENYFRSRANTSLVFTQSYFVLARPKPPQTRQCECLQCPLVSASNGL